MAEETQTKASEAAQEVVVAGGAAAAEEKEVSKELPPPLPASEAEEDPKKPSGEEAASSTDVVHSVSFKEEGNLVANLEDPEKKALNDLKQLVQAALANHEFSPPPPPPPAAEPPFKAEEEAKPEVPPPPAQATEEPAPQADVPPPPPTAAAEAVVEKDGARTVESIEVTVVPATSPSPSEEAPPAAPEEEKTPAPPPAAAAQPPEEVLIWGIPLLGDERSEIVLMKFLRARDLKVKEAMAMLKNAVIWRKEFGIEALLEEDLGIPEMEKVVFMHGTDKEGHPVCYNVYGEFQNKELYAMAFADEEKRQRFLRWRIQYLEKGIRQLLDFSPGGVSTMVQVTDLKNSIGPMKRELRHALTLLQDNYPEFAAKQIFINVPWWYLAFNRMISPFFTQRSKSKFVFAGPSKTAETLFKYIAPEQVPVQYGGLSKEKDPDFTAADAVTEIAIKPSTKQVIEIPVNEKCLLVWELRVLGWDVTFGAEFVPSSEDGYTVIVQKARKLVAADEPVEKNSFKIGEAGKVVLTVDNTTSKKKKLLYRYKIKSSTVSL
ncbi:patellin-3-like isoform X2 [Phoenix dactylifera]|uniref:Patellin-3-like isoform X2 n=1 Tax=Phoenix dactylifera TaxID=42345 RepID=A0A8B7BMH7_PHODC|nr:patellin-3-like isoform X2 [Phoenix dactylifera]